MDKDSLPISVTNVLRAIFDKEITTKEKAIFFLLEFLKKYDLEEINFDFDEMIAIALMIKDIPDEKFSSDDFYDYFGKNYLSGKREKPPKDEKEKKQRLNPSKNKEHKKIIKEFLVRVKTKGSKLDIISSGFSLFYENEEESITISYHDLVFHKNSLRGSVRFGKIKVEEVFKIYSKDLFEKKNIRYIKSMGGTVVRNITEEEFLEIVKKTREYYGLE